MSFNEQHIITRQNYEEYFMLYVDNELSATEKEAVDAFVILHPDLREELDILMSTKLDPEEFSFDGKELLKAEHIQLAGLDESLLMYMDNELDENEQEAVRKELANNPAAANHFAQLMKTKLDPSEQVVYPNKNELYRKEERAIRPMVWMRVAAVVILFAGATGLYLKLSSPATDINSNVVADVKPATKKLPDTQTVINEPVEQAAVVAQTEKVKPQTYQVRVIPNQKTKSVDLTIDDQIQNQIAQADAAFDRVVKNKVTAVAIENTTTAKTLELPVTKSNLQAYTTIEAAAETMVPVNATADTKRGSVRGLVRKTTRMIERRTGIKSINEEDELLLGVLAIKLK